MIARIYVQLKPDVSDPRGIAIKGSLESLGFEHVDRVHVGKYFIVEMDDELEPALAEENIRSMCEKLLSNPVIENYEFTIEESKQ